MSSDSEKLDAFNRLCAMPDALFAALGYRVTKVAKCDKVNIEKLRDWWHCWVRLGDNRSGYVDDGPTQLAALSAAVEAAEKGVRE